jgi:AcrR family transcriptional regulator
VADEGLRERKKLATRAALGRAAWRLISERGYDKVRVEDIAEAAGVSVRTFSNYFASKDQALLSIGEDRSQRVVAALSARPPGEDLWEALAAAIATSSPAKARCRAMTRIPRPTRRYSRPRTAA